VGEKGFSSKKVMRARGERWYIHEQRAISSDLIRGAVNGGVVRDREVVELWRPRQSLALRGSPSRRNSAVARVRVRRVEACVAGHEAAGGVFQRPGE